MATSPRPTSDQPVDPAELQQLWELSFEQTTRGICISDPEVTTLRAVNPAFARMHGGEPADFIGKDPTSIFSPVTAAEIPELIETVERDGFVSFESEHERLDGTTFRVATEAMSIRDEQGNERYKIGWFTDLSERSESDRRRREAQRQFEAAFSQAAVGMAMVGLDGRWLRANAVFCEMTGYDPETLYTLNFTDITHPDDLEANLESDRKLLSGRAEEYRLEKRYIRADGHPVWTLIVVSLVKDDEGTPVHYLVHAHDISLRKRIEEDFSREQRGAQQSEREMMCVSGPSGAIESFKGPWKQVLGRSEEEIRARGMVDSVHPDERPETAMAVGRLIRSPGEWMTFRSRWQTKDGGWCWLSWSAFGIGDGRIFWSVREADERVALERTAELRTQVIDSMAEGVCLVTVEDMRIVYANPSLERMLAYEPGELDGREVELLRPDDLTAEEEIVRLSSASRMREVGEASFEGRQRRRDGGTIWCRVATTIFDHPRYGSVWVAIFNDVSEERRTRDKAERLEAAKAEFLGSVSHELRTPLTSILGYAALLQDDADEQTRKHLDVIERNASRQLRLVEDLLSIARIQAGEFEVVRIPVDFAEIVELGAEAARPDAERAGLGLKVDVLGPVPLQGDADRLGQVVANLVSNAIKFTPAGGRVEVALRSDGRRARLIVADTGPGVRSSERTQLFDRLFRGEDARETEVSGAGLGLSIARSIVEAHEGRIDLAEGTGSGATFEVALPLG